jgi:hypothetical protein
MTTAYLIQVIDESGFKDGKQIVTVKGKLFFTGMILPPKMAEIQAKVEANNNNNKRSDSKAVNFEYDRATNTTSCELETKAHTVR